MDSDTFETIILVVIFVVAPLLQRLFKKKEPEHSWEEPPPYPEEAGPAPVPHPTGGGPLPYPANGMPLPYPGPDTSTGGAPYSAPDPTSAWDRERKRLNARLEEIVTHVNEVCDSARIEIATRRFVAPLEQFVIRGARELLGDLARNDGPPPDGASAYVDSLELVSAQVESFIGMRRNPALRDMLGDADAVAQSCYEPIAEFARAHRVPLTSNEPVTEYGYDLAIWTAFIPTGLAPIWVPRDFFERIAWWPALAHEMAHDFYNATAGFDESVRAHLGLVPQHLGMRPLAFSSEGLSIHELYRVFGGWLEELFCDVFGTLMCGPAYGWTLVHHFSRPRNPNEIARVRTDIQGRYYDEHPPPHLRLVAVAQILEEVGQFDDAEALRDEWADRHGGDPPAILFPVVGQQLGLPTEPLASIAADIAHRLYSEQLAALSGYRLSDVPGLDFGPHENKEAERVQAELLTGRVPHKTKPRAVVAGAVLAWRQAPEREAKFIQLARRAISAVGTFEHAHDAYDSDAYARPHPGAYAVDEAAAGFSGARLRESFLLHTILSPPRMLRRMRPGGAHRAGFLARPGR